MSLMVLPFRYPSASVDAKQETNQTLLISRNACMFHAKICVSSMKRSSPYDPVGGRGNRLTTKTKSFQVLMPAKMGAGQSSAPLQGHPSTVASREEKCDQLDTRVNDGGIIAGNEEISILYYEHFSEGKHEDRALEKQGCLKGGEFCFQFILASVSLGIALWVLDSDQPALAFWPEGPLVEEFWENMRRYGLYALTVGTGALYTVFKPIGDLLRSPITAVLVIVIISGSFYLLYLTLSAMFGISDFSYLYAS